MRNITFMILFSTLSILGCFKHQGHEIIEPEWPRYKFGGIVSDSLTGTPVDSCIVTVIAYIIVYDDNFTSAVDTTDSTGAFLFDSIPVGQYWLTVEREGYCPFLARLDMSEYQDILDYNVSILKLSDAPNIELSVSEFNVTLGMDEILDTTFTISNSGKLTLDWTLDESPAKVSWLNENPTSGSVFSQDSQVVSINFNTYSVLKYGIYTAMLVISSNDCDEPIKEIYVKLTVQQ